MIKNNTASSLGVKANSFSILAPSYAGNAFCIEKHDGINTISSVWASLSGGVAVNSEYNMLVLKFKAVKSGNAGIYIPVINKNAVYAKVNKGGLIITDKEGLIYSYDPDESTGEVPLVDGTNVKIGVLEVGSEKLASPGNLKINDRNVTWDAVKKADKYVVSIIVKQGEETKYSDTVSVSEPSYTIPENVKAGDVTISVTAVSNDENIADSAPASATTKFTTTLDKPANLVWNENADGVKWDAVNGALGYEVTFGKAK